MKTLTFYSGKLWHSDKPFPVKHCTETQCLAEPGISPCECKEDIQAWLSTAYEVTNPMEAMEAIGLGKWKGVDNYKDGEQITLPDGYGIEKTDLEKLPPILKATITLPEKPENSAHRDSFENHPLNFVAGPKPKPSREERHKRLADKIQQAKKEKVTESFTRLEMEKMFCMGMLNQRSESIVDLLSQQIPEAQSKMDKIIEEIKNRRVEPSESQEETSNFAGSKIGSHHWAATLLSYIMRVGEYLHDHGAEEKSDVIYRGWGQGIKERAQEVNNYLQSLKDKP